MTALICSQYKNRNKVKTTYLPKRELANIINEYDRCVANKFKWIDRKQCTIVWYVDDAKVSHESPEVVKDIIGKIEEKFGRMNTTYGNEQSYLGMKLKITKDKKIGNKYD